MNQLQKVLESLETACGNRCNAEYNPCHYREAIAIVKQMMQAEPVAWKVNADIQNYQGQSEYRTILAFRPDPVAAFGRYEINEVISAQPLYTHPAPQAVPAEPSCPDCKAPDLLYECIHCSASNYPAVPKVTAGFVLVPMEATQEMISAGRTTPMPSDSEFDEDEDYRAVYKAMCAAAPKVTE
jgi:hypothetical protein